MAGNLTKEQKDALISQFCSVAGESITVAEAERVLGYSDWDVEAALSNHYAGGYDEGDTDDAPTSQAAASTGGARYLDGRPAPEASGSSTQPSSSRPQRGAEQRGIRTFSEMVNRGGGHGHGHHDEDDDEDDENKNHDFFTGGEKSGLAVHNPGRGSAQDAVDRILSRAQRNIPRPGGDEDSDEPAQPSRFRGGGATLGSDDTPSQYIADPNADRPAPPPRVTRELHLWQDGFSVDDGELYRYDDPANRLHLEAINQGRAPLSILNVDHDQEVDVTLIPHKEEKYVAPKKKYKPFADAGRRLGSPVPGTSSSGAAASSSSASAPTASSSSPSSTAQPTVNVDNSKPLVNLQIRLGDGTRLVSRFNTTHTIGDVYAFVNASSPASTQRNYVLMTTFPNKDLMDHSVILGDLPDFKRGGTVVQKWT